jgi:hypothetical protein
VSCWGCGTAGDHAVGFYSVACPPGVPRHTTQFVLACARRLAPGSASPRQLPRLTKLLPLTRRGPVARCNTMSLQRSARPAANSHGAAALGARVPRI